MNWHEYFYYDESSPSCLRWKVDVFCGRYKQTKNASAGGVAGSLSNDKYWRVMLNKKLYQVHRIIYEMLIGKIVEGLQIDHFDRNPSNNCITNLRQVTRRENNQNRSLHENNTSGKGGVTREDKPDTRCGKTYSYWKAHWITARGKRATKYFSILKHGEVQAFHLACEYRDKMIKELNEVHGQAYTETHGQ